MACPVDCKENKTYSAIEKYTSLQILPPLFQSRAIQMFHQNGSIMEASFLIFPDYLQKLPFLEFSSGIKFGVL